MPHISLRSLYLSAIIVAVVALTGCDDPSAVGIGIIGDRGGEPFVEFFDPLSISPAEAQSITGQAQRYLVGQVSDDLLGTLRANAFIDFVPAVIPTSFRDGTVSHAELRFDRNYVFGDTTGTVTVNIYDMPADWDAVDAPSDTTFPVGALITTQSISLQDSTVTLPLPSDWVARNDTTMRSTHFSDVFHGFFIEATSGTGVGGFASGGGRLIASTVSDTASFSLSRVVTSVERLADAQHPTNVLPAQAVAGPAVELAFDFGDFRTDYALNRVSVRVEADTLLSQSSLPPNYLRPQTRDLSLYVRFPDGGRSIVETAGRGADGTFVFQSNSLQSLINSHLQNFIDIESFEIRASSAQITLDHAFLRVGEDGRPSVSLTLTPLLD